jgi:hypothetical protein
MTPSRVSVTMDWLSALAAMGARDQTLCLSVPPVEMQQWILESAMLRAYDVEPNGLNDIQFYGPAGLVMRVFVADKSTPQGKAVMDHARAARAALR